MATTTYNDESVPTRFINMFWIGLVVLIAAILVAFFAMNNRSGVTGRPQSPPATQEIAPNPQPSPGP
jgi:hypothetical protein